MQLDIPGDIGQYHGCWCAGSLCRQIMSGSWQYSISVYKRCKMKIYFILKYLVWEHLVTLQFRVATLLIVNMGLCPGLTQYNDVIMDTIASQITSLTVVYSIVYSGADQRKHQPMNSPHKKPVTRKMFPFVDVTMFEGNCHILITITAITFSLIEIPHMALDREALCNVGLNITQLMLTKLIYITKMLLTFGIW